ncbi:MAG: dimethylargininase [Acidobacteriia bacterium]|nr:dimethylargininase [Terriglobia bacterium]
MRLAITREVSRQIGLCELTYQARQPINIDLARIQHRLYEECLRAAGCSVHRLPEEPDLPDSVFVEDAAVVLDELAVITRPGAVIRRQETRSVADALRPYRHLVCVEAPGVLDGGDVLRLGRNLFVGLSQRSNEAATRQLHEMLQGYGYAVTGVQVKGCLHLKSAVTQVAENVVLINPHWVDGSAFNSMQLIEVDPNEPSAANALMIGDSVVFPSAYPATRRRLEARGIQVRVVDASELAKAEGGVTCCSLIL